MTNADFSTQVLLSRPHFKAYAIINTDIKTYSAKRPSPKTGV